MSIARKLKRLAETHGPDVGKVLAQAIKEKKFDPYSVRLADLTEAFLGRDYLTVMAKATAIKQGQVHTLEASEAVDATAFSNITGQLLVTVVKEKYSDAEFIGDNLVRKIPNPGANIKEHKVPYLSDVDSEPPVIAGAEPYPFAKFAEQWVTIPAPEKRGHICTVTMEMLLSDYTGQAQDSAGSVGRALGYGREKRILRTVLGISNSYKFNDTSMNTYLSTANATGKYVNRVFSNTIVNYTGIETVEKLAWEMEDPQTERRINVQPKAILCVPEKHYELKRILNATETRSGNQASDIGNLLVAPNPLETNYTLYRSKIAQALLDDETALTAAQIKQYVILADFAKAFVYREVYPLKVEQAPAGNPYEFNQDIVLAVKASEFGVPGVYDPRYAFLSTSEGS